MRPLIVRIWRTGLDESRAPEYEDFARTVSLPMFRRHDGFGGVLFARSGGERVVITLWEDRAAAEALGESAGYRATVKALEATGFLCPPKTIELLDVHRAWTGPLDHDLGCLGRVLAAIHAAARKRHLICVPVLKLSDRPPDVGLIRDAVVSCGRGVALRFPLLTLALREGQTLDSLIKETLARVEVEICGADLLIDLGFLSPDQDIYPEDITRSVDELVGIGEWRSVALLGTSMPSMLGGVIAEGTVGELRRREWELWSALKRIPPQRLPTYGDYVVQHPHPPQDESGGGPNMRVNIRYTTDRVTLVARGRGAYSVEGREQYRGLCLMLVDRSEFAGGDYSWGDTQIAACASGALDPGSNNAWRGAGSSHHLRMVTEQVSA